MQPRLAPPSRIYLDWNATSPLLPSAREAMLRALDTPGNASSIHREGQAARAIVERARRAMARAVGATPQQVTLTGGATESNNQVLRAHARWTPSPFIACTRVEHPSVLEVVASLHDAGTRAAWLEVDTHGRLDMAALTRCLERGATLVSVMWANNEIGNIYPVADIARLVHDAGALLHVDATQAWGRLPVNMPACGADYLTLSTHKMGGPKGAGAIITRQGVTLEATLAGGHQERGKRPGTENLVALAGMEAACLEVMANQPAWQARMEQQRTALLAALTAHGLAPEVRGDPAARLPNTLNLSLGAVSGEDMLLGLDLEGVAASSGSACTAGSLEPSHVLLAMGCSEAQAKRSLRLSFGPSTRDEALEEAAARIARVWRRLADAA